MMNRPILPAAAAALVAVILPGGALAQTAAAPVPAVQVAQAGPFADWPADRARPPAAALAGVPVFDADGARVGEVFEAMPAADGSGLERVAVEMDDEVAVADEEPVVLADATLVLHDGAAAVRLGRSIGDIL